MSTTAPTSAERRYRRLLLLLPSWYRERYVDEMVEVYLAARPDDDARPGAAEVAATVRLAVTTRTGQMGRPSSATLVLLAVVGSAALATLAVRNTVIGVSFLLSQERTWSLGTDGRLIAVEPSADLGDIVDARSLIWVVVLALLLTGLRRSATAVAALVVVVDVGAAFAPFFGPDASILELAIARTDARAALLPVIVVVALLLAGSAPGARPGGRPRVTAAAGTVAALGLGYAGVVSGVVDAADETFWPVASAAVAAAALVVLVASRRLDPVWPATVLVLAVLVVLAGLLPAGSRSVGGGVEQTVTDGPLDPVLVPGLIAGAVAAVLAAVAWLAAVDRRPDHRARPGRRPDLVTG